MIARERLWKTDKGGIVGEGHKDAVSLLCGIGQEVPKEYRDQLNDGRASKVKEETKVEKKKREAEEAAELQKKKDEEEEERMEKEEEEEAKNKEAEGSANKEKTGEENKGSVTVNKK